MHGTGKRQRHPRTQRERLRQTHRPGCLPHDQPGRQGRQDDAGDREDRQGGLHPVGIRRIRPDDNHPQRNGDTYRCLRHPAGRKGYPGGEGHQPPRRRFDSLRHGRSQKRRARRGERRNDNCCGGERRETRRVTAGRTGSPRKTDIRPVQPEPMKKTILPHYEKQ